MKRYFAFLLGVCCAISVEAAGEKLYVQSAQAKLFATPSFQASVIAIAHKGEDLVLVEKNNQWSKVTYKDKTAWVSTLLLGAQPPHDKVTVIKEKQDAAQKDHARRRASSTTSAAAARGLRADERARLSDDSKADYSALEKVENTKVDEKDVQEFAQDKGK